MRRRDLWDGVLRLSLGTFSDGSVECSFDVRNGAFSLSSAEAAEVSADIFKMFGKCERENIHTCVGESGKT